MNMSQAYIAISVIVLAVIAIFIFVLRKNENKNRLTTLASLAFLFVLAGILFGEERIVGYGLMGIGVILAIIDMVKRSNR